MNKKFFKVSLLIFLPIIILLAVFSICLKDAYVYDWDREDDYTIKYKSYEEDDNSHIVTVTFKNNNKNIASLSDLKLSFNYIGEGNNVGDLYFNGQEEKSFTDDYVLGVNPGEERDIIFKIPKAVKLDENKYNTKSMNIDCMVQYFKFRRSDTALLFRVMSTGGSSIIGEEDYK